MGCKTTYCVGGGCEPTSTDVQGYVEAFGYTYNESDPLASTYLALIAQSPAEFQNNAVWKALAEACMRVRGMLFCNSKPGDAGSTASSSANSNLLGVSTSLGLKAAQTAESIAGLGITSALGAATFGVGLVLGPLIAAFQQHAAAESKQANALTNLAPYVTEFMRKSDIAVATGQASAQDAVSAIHQMAQTMAQQDAPLTKSCNAFCGYNQIAILLAEISSYYYQLPVSSTSLEQSDETNVITASNVVPFSHGTSGELAAVTSNVNFPAIIAVVGVGLVVLFFGVLRKGMK